MDALPADLAPPPPRTQRPQPASTAQVLQPWLRAQSINVTRHAAALRPFRREEFGTGASSPSEGHIQAANALIASLRQRLITLTGNVTSATAAAATEPTTAKL